MGEMSPGARLAMSHGMLPREAAARGVQNLRNQGVPPMPFMGKDIKMKDLCPAAKIAVAAGYTPMQAIQAGVTEPESEACAIAAEECGCPGEQKPSGKIKFNFTGAFAQDGLKLNLQPCEPEPAANAHACSSGCGSSCSSSGGGAVANAGAGAGAFANAGGASAFAGSPGGFGNTGFNWGGAGGAAGFDMTSFLRSFDELLTMLSSYFR